MPILAEEYDTALREIRSLRLDLRAEKLANDHLCTELRRITDALQAAQQERNAARADAEALQAELGRVRAERDHRRQPIETAPRDGSEVLVWDAAAGGAGG